MTTLDPAPDRAPDGPPTVAEIAALTRRLRELSAQGRAVDPAARAAFLADKQALLTRITDQPTSARLDGAQVDGGQVDGARLDEDGRPAAGCCRLEFADHLDADHLDADQFDAEDADGAGSGWSR